jgi:hypothetical protein
MDMYCPECMNPLDTQDGKTAVCSAHQARFQILFARHEMIPTVPLAAGASASIDTNSTDAAAQRLTAAFGGYTPPAADCIKHPGSPAVARCQVCQSPVCSTCLFVFPGGLHLCPGCAANPNPKVSSKRKKLVIWSVVLGGVSVAGLIGFFALIMSGSLRRTDQEAVGTLGTFVSLMPAIVGLALGVGSFDRKLKTPALAWVGVVCNGVIVALWVLLMLVGMMKG